MTTRGNLLQSVDEWLARDDVAVTGSQRTWIMKMAESYIARDVRLITQEVSTTLTFTGREADLPADFLGQRTPFIDDNIRKFEYKTPEAIREASSWNDGRVGAFYTLEGSNDPSSAHDDRVKMVIAGPASAASPLTVTVNYYARLPELQAINDTNWLIQKHYDIYLYATLFVACEYLRETQLAQYYENKYRSVVAKQNELENKKRYGTMPKQSYANPRSIV